MNVKLPLDGPLFRVYFQRYEPEDQDYLPEEKRAKSLMIWKCHHGFCDGASSLQMVLALSDDFNKDYFVKSQDLNIF